MKNIKDILTAVANGNLSVENALGRLDGQGITDLGYAMVDHDRKKRCGFPEVIYGENKTPDQILGIINTLLDKNGYALATRVSEKSFEKIKKELKAAEYNPIAKTILVGKLPSPAKSAKKVLVVAAGTSDLPVAEEAYITVKYAGVAVEKLYDAGVAGIHRLLSHQDMLEDAGVIIVVAGMEGALPSVVGGLVSCPVLAVPTSVGYGASFGGVAALLGMLNSCASGVGVFNIDNGFGAGILAARIILNSAGLKS